MSTRDDDRLEFGPDYVEHVELRDGTRALVRHIRPEDKDLLRRGFERLSPESRYRRFLLAKRALSKKELRLLTEVDGWDHVALGAILVRDAAPPDPLGIARFVRDDDDPRVAEVAVAVVDDFQGRGLGSRLLQRLGRAARERGVERFRVVLRTDNLPMRKLAADLGPTVSVQVADGILTAEFDLVRGPDGAEEATPVQGGGYRLLSIAAGGADA